MRVLPQVRLPGDLHVSMRDEYFVNVLEEFSRARIFERGCMDRWEGSFRLDSIVVSGCFSWEEGFVEVLSMVWRSWWYRL